MDAGASGELGVNALSHVKADYRADLDSVLEGVVLELERCREDVTRINANVSAHFCQNRPYSHINSRPLNFTHSVL